MNMGKIRPYTLLIIILSLPFFIAADVLHSEEENKDNQARTIEKDLSHEKEQYLQFNLKEKGLLDQLEDIEKEVNEKKTVIKNLSENLETARGELKRQREALKAIESSYEAMKSVISQRLAVFYKYSERGYLKIFTGSEDMTQLNHMIKYLKVILNKDLDAIKKVSGEQQIYKQQVALIEKQLNNISAMEQDESSRVQSLKTDIDNKVVLLSRIHREKEFYETAVKELGSASENLKDTIRDLDAREEKIVENKSTVLPSGFADLKGRLPLPIEGKVLKEPRGAKDNILSGHKGIYIDGDFGSNVRSVYQGRVDYSGQLKGYGQVIVINHGSRYFTISACLSRRNKVEGDAVERGEIIGQAGETGLKAGSGLYFEIRKGDSNLDPLKWLKVN